MWSPHNNDGGVGFAGDPDHASPRNMWAKALRWVGVEGKDGRIAYITQY